MTLLAEQAGPITFIIFLVVAVLIVMAVIYGAKAANKQDAELEQLARRLGGNLQPSGLFKYPELRIPHLGQTATLKYTAGGENESNKTHLTIPWPSGRLRCEIFLEGPLSGLRKLIGMQDIEIGSPDFDRQFIITGNDEAAIKAFLTPDAQARLLDLLRVNATTAFSVPNMYLQIGNGLLTVTKASYLTDMETVDRFIQLFLAFYDAAMRHSRCRHRIPRRCFRAVHRCFWRHPSPLHRLRRSPEERPRHLPQLPHAPPQGLLAILRGLRDLRLRREAVCPCQAFR